MYKYCNLSPINHLIFINSRQNPSFKFMSSKLTTEVIIKYHQVNDNKNL